MTNKINLIQKLKFNLWYFSKIFPMIGSPVRAIGKLSTTNFMKKYYNYLKKQGTDIFPSDRYKREEIDLRIQSSLKTEFIDQSNHILEVTKEQLSEYFHKKRSTFDLPLLTIILSNSIS